MKKTASRLFISMVFTPVLYTSADPLLFFVIPVAPLWCPYIYPYSSPALSLYLVRCHYQGVCLGYGGGRGCCCVALGPNSIPVWRKEVLDRRVLSSFPYWTFYPLQFSLFSIPVIGKWSPWQESSFIILSFPPFYLEFHFSLFQFDER
jgi:hypothetical protein